MQRVEDFKIQERCDEVKRFESQRGRTKQIDLREWMSNVNNPETGFIKAQEFNLYCSYYATDTSMSIS